MTETCSLLIIEHTVAVAVKIGIRDLLPELLAHALVFFTPLQTAGAVASGLLQTLPDGLDDLGIFIQSNSHVCLLLL